MTRRNKVNILLVDDNEINLMGLKKILGDLDENLICVVSGEEALLEVEKNDFAAIMLDVKMPGMDGFEVASAIRNGERNQAVPILFLTAHEGSMDKVLEGYSAGAVDYMVKPCVPEIIKSKVGVFVDLYRMREEIARQHDLQKERDLQKKNARELAKLNEALEESNQNLNLFADIVSHDLHEPLRMVSSFLTLLVRKHKDKLDEKALQYIDFAVDGSVRMQDMLQGLLNFSRVQTRGEPLCELDLAELVEAAVKNHSVLIEESGAKISIDTLSNVTGDRTQLIQVFQNLIGNAIKFCDKSPPVIRIIAREEKNGWSVTVADEGIGIDPKNFERIFQIFQRLALPGGILRYGRRSVRV